MMTARTCHGSRNGALALAFGVMIAAVPSGGSKVSAGAAGGPVRCEIQVTPLGVGVELRGVVFADADVQGAYALQVSTKGGGRSNINQAGKFTARPDVPAKLGSVRIGGDSSTYLAKLTVTWNGEEIECEKIIGGGWL